LDLNGNERVIIQLSVPENYGFDTIITNVGLLLLLHVTPFQPSSMSLLRVHLNGIGNITSHLKVPDNYEFHTNVGRLRLFVQNIKCTYDLANGKAKNNVNGMHVFC
jgi:hypothetical protein